MMNLKTLAAVAALFTVGLGAAHATTIINLDATQGMGSWGNETDAATRTETLAAGSYTVSVIDNTAVKGGYNGYNYNSGTTIREAFDFKIGNGPVISVDVGSHGFASFATSADALAAFSSGPYTLYGASGSHYDATNVGSLQSLSFTLQRPTTVTFGIPDNLFSDNKGGVSLALTAAVPEPETYAMMLAGLGALGFVARRRKAG